MKEMTFSNLKVDCKIMALFLWMKCLHSVSLYRYMIVWFLLILSWLVKIVFTKCNDAGTLMLWSGCCSSLPPFTETRVMKPFNHMLMRPWCYSLNKKNQTLVRGSTVIQKSKFWARARREQSISGSNERFSEFRGVRIQVMTKDQV